MKLRWLPVLLLLEAAPVHAEFLTCDCTPVSDQVTSFQLQFDNGVWADEPAADQCGTEAATKVVCAAGAKTICKDLTFLSVGPHTAKGRAVNAGGVSADSSPFSFTKVAAPSSPSLLRRIK